MRLGHIHIFIATLRCSFNARLAFLPISGQVQISTTVGGPSASQELHGITPVLCRGTALIDSIKGQHSRVEMKMGIGVCAKCLSANR